MFRQQKYGRSLSICFLDISSHLCKSIVAQLHNNHPKSTKRVTPNLNLNHHSLLFFPTWLQQNPHFARNFPWTFPNLLVNCYGSHGCHGPRPHRWRRACWQVRCGHQAGAGRRRSGSPGSKKRSSWILDRNISLWGYNGSIMDEWWIWVIFVIFH